MKEKTKIIELFGEVESDKTLLDLKKQAGDTELFEELVVKIATPGGSVSEGLEIMMWLDSLSAMGKKIITLVVANSYSIGSLIMLAADIKLISKHGKVMVHNPMIPELQYVSANELEKHVEDLRNLENYMYDLYGIFTGLEKEQIKQLMDNETYLSPQEAVDYGFSDMVIDIKPKSFEMTVNNNKIINMSKTINILNRVIGMVNKSEYVNQIYTDKDGSEIQIFQADPSTFKKGDKTNVENGEVILSDGSKLTIENFIITDIDRTLEQNETSDEQISTDKSDEVSVEGEPESNFNVGDSPKESVNEEGELKEYELKDGRKIVVSSDNVIQFIDPEKEALEENESMSKEVESKEGENDLEAKLKDLEIKNNDLEAKLSEIEKKIDTEAKEVEKKLKKIDQFQVVATEAIDKVASNMNSNFKPEPKVKTNHNLNGSIFEQMKAKAGLK